MTAEVILFVQEGRLTAEREYSFSTPCHCVIGRSHDADIRLGQAAGFVSRRHCILEINPPDIRIRDLGSLNGTFVNGLSIGQRRTNIESADAAAKSPDWHTLSAGDVICLGSVRIRVTILSSRTARRNELPRLDLSRAPQPHVSAR